MANGRCRITCTSTGPRTPEGLERVRMAHWKHGQRSAEAIRQRKEGAALRREIWPLLEEGRMKPVVYRTFELVEAAAAHRLMESSQHVGKIVLTTHNA